MRKNLHYKVLASVLAIAGLYFYNAPAAWAAIQQVSDNVWVGNGTITNNNNQQIQTDAEVYGGHDGYNSNANNNNITITGDNNSFYRIAGGYTSSGTATNNTVTISGDVTLTDTNYNSCIAGGIGYSSSTVTQNQVTIQSGTVTGNIYGGYVSSASTNPSEISDNNITITNTEGKITDISGADLYGGYANNSSTTTISNNTLTLDGWSGSVKSLHNFSDIYINNFKLNTNLIDVGSVSGMKGVTIHLGAFNATNEDFKLNAGDYEEKSSVEAAKIEWDEDIKGSVVFTDENGNDVDNFDDSLFAGSLANQTINNTFYIEDRTDGDGVYATKFDNESGYSASHEKDANYVSITAKVKKSVLAGKFIDENGQEHTNTQTQNR